MRAVLDTNVLLSMRVSPGATISAIADAVEAGRFTPITSPLLLSELLNVLQKPRLQRYHRLDADGVAAFVQWIARLSDVVAPTEPISVADDPDDNRVLEAAVAGEADYIITGDDDLLRLGEFRGSRIVTPAEFVILLQMESE